ncbi:MAG: flavodoxin [Planctomycetota bacterium]
MSQTGQSEDLSIGIFFGSDTGNTERIAEMLKEQLGPQVTTCKNIDDSSIDEFLEHDVLLFGVSTWNIGEIQYSWEELLEPLSQTDFGTRRVGLFGLGDAAGYPDTFVDGLGILWESLGTQRPQLIGKWSKEGYIFDDSRGMADDDHFLGLVVDEDFEPEHTDDRVARWVEQIRDEIGLRLRAAG